MSAVEALAEVLRGVSAKHDIGAYNGSQSACGWCRKWMTNAEYREHVAELQSAALVAAIRSMPAEQVAELIGGEVQEQTEFVTEAESAERTQRQAIEDRRYEIGERWFGFPIIEIVARHRRVVTPWTTK